MKNIRIFALFALFSLTLCNGLNWQTVSTADFSIKLPADMKSYKGQMLDSAIIEYANLDKDIFLVVSKEHDSLQMPLDSARKQYIDFYILDDTVAGTYKITDLGKNAQMVEAETISTDMDFSTVQTYWVAGVFRASPTDYYVVWTWTDRMYRKNNGKTLKRIVKSFKIRKQ